MAPKLIFCGKIDISNLIPNENNREINRKRKQMLETEMMMRMEDEHNPILAKTSVNLRCFVYF
jgi:hypothetical protein